MIAFIGEIAALLAAAAFSVTSVCYTFAGRKIDALTSIAMSLPLSWVMIVVIHQFALERPFPRDATWQRWWLLGASGILAYVVSSYFMLNAYQDIGPRLTLLIASFAPALGALLDWLFLGQTLPPDSLLGIVVVILGIVSVVVERGKPQATPQTHLQTHPHANQAHLNVRRGLLLASLGTLAQAAAFVFSSQGVEGDYSPLSATLIRITAGIVALWVFIALQGRLKATVTVFNHDLRLFWLLSGAALSGPIIAGSLPLLSFQYIPVGVSTTLSHTTALFLIPVGYFVFKERITPRAVIGTVVATVGIAILFI